MKVILTKSISKVALTNAVNAAEAAAASITDMVAATGAAGTEVVWDNSTSTLTVPRGDTGATGEDGDGADHLLLTNVGTNTHAEIDTHMTNSAQKNEVNVFTAGQSGNKDIIPSATTVNFDMSASNRFEIIMTNNLLVSYPTNLVLNQGGVIYLIQDATGGRTITWNSAFKFMNTDESLGTANDVQVYSYEVYSATKIIVTYIGVI